MLAESFYEAVNSGNVRKLRIMMKDSLLVDPTFKELNEMETAAAMVPGLYDEHDGEPFVLDRIDWNDDYLNKQKVQLIYNFSHERLNHLKEVVHVLRPVSENQNANSFNRPQSTTEDEHISYEEQKAHDQQNGTYKGAAIAGGAVVGAVVGGVIAAVAGVTVVGGAVAGAVVGGAAVSFAVLGGK